MFCGIFDHSGSETLRKKQTALSNMHHVFVICGKKKKKKLF